MRILIITKYFPPENSIASLRPYSWAKYWTRFGHTVEVLTTVKPLQKAHNIPVNSNGFKVNEVDYNATYHLLKNGVGKYFKKKPKAETEEVRANNNLNAFNKNKPTSKFLSSVKAYKEQRGILMAQRMPDFMDLWIKPALNWARQAGKWDLVVSSFAPYSCHLIAYELKKEDLTSLWLADFRDLWTDHHIYKGVFPFTSLERYLEKKVIAKADKITTVSQPLADTLKKKYPLAKVHVIENGFDSEELNDLPKERIFTDNKVRIIHTGTIYKDKMSPELLFKAIGQIAESESAHLLKNLEVIFAGSNNEVVMDLAKRMSIAQWVKDVGFLPRRDILRMQREAHVLLFLGFDKGRTAGLVSGKLFEYLFSETPIWAIEVDEAFLPGQWIVEAEAGILFGEDLDLLKKSLLNLLQVPTKKKELLNKGFLQKFERGYLAQSMLRLMA